MIYNYILIIKNIKMKTKIKLTKINEDRIGWHGKMLDRYFNETLFLRKARNIGDEEIVNNYVLGQLNKCKEFGGIDFICN